MGQGQGQEQRKAPESESESEQHKGFLQYMESPRQEVLEQRIRYDHMKETNRDCSQQEKHNHGRGRGRGRGRGLLR